MRTVFGVAALLGLTVASELYRDKEVCLVHDLEIVLLMDVSGGTRDFFDQIAENLARTVKQMEQSFTSVKVGLANFVDKPNVYVGVGTYGGYPGTYVEDWCYDLVSPLAPLTEDSVESISAKIREQGSGAGLDMYDAHFEALVTAVTDPNMGWSLRNKYDGRQLSKLVLMVTDHFGHTAEWKPVGEYVDAFNQDVWCKDNISRGGFGAQSASPAIPSEAVWTAYDSTYWAYAGLLAREVCDQEPLTEDEKAQMAELREKLEPIRVPSVKPFDLNVLLSNQDEHCRFHEYPAYADISTVMQQEDVGLAVILVDLENSHLGSWSVPHEVWNWALTDETALGGVKNTWKVVDASSVEKMPEVVLEAVEALFPPDECPTPTTTEEVTTLATTEEVCEPSDCDGSCCSHLYEIFFETSRQPTAIEVAITL